GGSGNDQIIGGAGSDYIDAGDGDDVVYGGAGDDIIVGGAGDDVLSGGSGNDVFVFGGGGGQDVVLDFEAGSDLLQIARNVNGLDIGSASDLADRVSTVDGNAVIDLGNG